MGSDPAELEFFFGQKPKPEDIIQYSIPQSYQVLDIAKLFNTSPGSTSSFLKENAPTSIVATRANEGSFDFSVAQKRYKEAQKEFKTLRFDLLGILHEISLAQTGQDHVLAEKISSFAPLLTSAHKFRMAKDTVERYRRRVVACILTKNFNIQSIGVVPEFKRQGLEAGMMDCLKAKLRPLEKMYYQYGETDHETRSFLRAQGFADEYKTIIFDPDCSVLKLQKSLSVGFQIGNRDVDLNQDLPSILSIERQSTRDPWSEERFRAPENIILVAEHKGEVVAFVVYTFEEDNIKIHNMAVAMEHRRKGVGSYLMDILAHKILINYSCDGIEINIDEVPKIAGFAEKSGFEPCYDSMSYSATPHP